MVVGKSYSVTKRIKLHTKPLVVADITQVGVFVKETPKQFIFRNFRVYKANVFEISIL